MSNPAFIRVYFYSVLIISSFLIFLFSIPPIIILLLLFVPMLIVVSKNVKKISIYLQKNDINRFNNESYYYSSLNLRYFNALNVFGYTKFADENINKLYESTKKGIIFFLLSFIYFITCQILYY